MSFQPPVGFDERFGSCRSWFPKVPKKVLAFEIKTHNAARREALIYHMYSTLINKKYLVT